MADLAVAVAVAMKKTEGPWSKRCHTGNLHQSIAARSLSMFAGDHLQRLHTFSLEVLKCSPGRSGSRVCK